MSDEQDAAPGSAGFTQPWIAQLRKITDELAGMTGLGEPAAAQPAAALQNLPRPGALSAAQLDAITKGVSAQRSSIAALQAQLRAFDDQLAMLEGVLGPLAAWSSRWAEWEHRLGG